MDHSERGRRDGGADLLGAHGVEERPQRGVRERGRGGSSGGEGEQGGWMSAEAASSAVARGCQSLRYMMASTAEITQARAAVLHLREEGVAKGGDVRDRERGC